MTKTGGILGILAIITIVLRFLLMPVQEEWALTPVYSLGLLNVLTLVFLLAYLSMPTARTDFDLNCIIAMMYILYLIEAFSSIDCFRYENFTNPHDPNPEPIVHCQKHSSPLYISIMGGLLSLTVMATILGVLISHPLKRSQKIALSLFFIGNTFYILTYRQSLFFFQGTEWQRPDSPTYNIRQRARSLLISRNRNRTHRNPSGARPTVSDHTMIELAQMLGVPSGQGVQLLQNQEVPRPRRAGRQTPSRRSMREQDRKMLDILSTLTDRDEGRAPLA